MTKEQQKYVFIVFAVVAFVFVYFNFFLQPVNRGIKNKNARIKELTTMLTEAKREAEQLEQLKTKIAALEYEYKELQLLLPAQKDLPDLIRRLTTLSQRFGIRIQSIETRPVVTTASTEYDEIPFGLTITGTFHTILEFLTELGQQDRLMSARDLQLSAQVTAEKLATASGSFTMVAFKLKGS